MTSPFFFLTRLRKMPDFPSGIGAFCFTPCMKTCFTALLITAIFILPNAGLAGGKKEGKASVTFHMETEATDNPKMIFPHLANGQRRFFRRMPEIGIKDILSFRPFPSDVSGEYGVIFKLKSNAVNRLAAITSANSGRWMISQVNGRAVDGFLIDKQVTDGLVVVWKGVTLQDIAIFDEQLPRVGEEGKKKKK